MERTGIGRVEDESAPDAESYCPDEDVCGVSEDHEPRMRDDVVRAAVKGGSEADPHKVVLGSNKVSAAESPRPPRGTRDQTSGPMKLTFSLGRSLSPGLS